MSRNMFKTVADADDFLNRLYTGNVESYQPTIGHALKGRHTSDEVVKHIMEYPYRLTNIPVEAATLSPYEMSPDTAGPIRKPFGPEVGQGNYTIDWMIKTYAKRIPFEFANWEDAIDVTKYLQLYIKMTEKDLADLNAEAADIKSEEVTDALENTSTYLHLAKVLYVEMYKISIKLANYNREPATPMTLEQYRIDRNKKKLGFDLDDPNVRNTITHDREIRFSRGTQDLIMRTRRPRSR